MYRRLGRQKRTPPSPIIRPGGTIRDFQSVASFAYTHKHGKNNNKINNINGDDINQNRHEADENNSEPLLEVSSYNVPIMANGPYSAVPNYITE